MAYGSGGIDRLTQRLEPLLGVVDPERLVLVLRASDYGSEWEMEVMRNAVAASTGIEEMAVHDLGGFLRLIEDRP